VWGDSSREWNEKQKKTDNTKRVEKGTSVINAVPEGKQWLEGHFGT
jgi:hypothetical protein